MIVSLLGCTTEEAKWLAYVGTENTFAYENLSESEKQAVIECMKRCKIKY